MIFLLDIFTLQGCITFMKSDKKGFYIFTKDFIFE